MSTTDPNCEKGMEEGVIRGIVSDGPNGNDGVLARNMEEGVVRGIVSDSGVRVPAAPSTPMEEGVVRGIVSEPLQLAASRLMAASRLAKEMRFFETGSVI